MSKGEDGKTYRVEHAKRKRYAHTKQLLRNEDLGEEELAKLREHADATLKREIELARAEAHRVPPYKGRP